MVKRKRVKKLRFNTSIYKKEAIEKAVSVYSEFANFSLCKNSRFIEIKINNAPHNVKGIIVDEFANYVLGLTKKCL